MKVISFIKYLFLTIGLGSLIGAFYFYQDKQTFLKNADVAEGTVKQLYKSKSIKKSIEYIPVVLYITKKGEQIEFVSSHRSNLPIYHKGEKVEVLYNVKDPYKAEINGFSSLWGNVLFFGIFGVSFFSVGFSIFLTGYLRKKKAEYLLANGKPVMTTFSRVIINTGVKANGESPFQIHSQWIDPNTHQLYVFKSYNIWFDPTSYIRTENLRVMIEPGNPKKYYMDISFLPKMGN
jgi:hypothetical protein